MSNLKANTWVMPTLINKDGVNAGVPYKITEIAVPYSAAAGYTGGYQLISQATTSNTNQLYSFTYTPVRTSSKIYYLSTLGCDRNSNTNSEALYIFINGSPYSESYTYPRNSGHEPWQARCQQGVYTNTTGGVLTFSIRARNGGGWTQYIGGCLGNDQPLANKIQIFEYGL